MTVIPMPGAKKAPADKRSTTETLLLTQEVMKLWVVPWFQRSLRVNQKVRDVSEQIAKDGGVIRGVITLGIVPNDDTQYLIDGQHRREAALMSGVEEFYADVRRMHFSSMSEMAKEFVDLNSSLVKMTPDDILKGLEASIRPLSVIRAKCPFIGYNYIRAGGDGAQNVVGMSAALRQWRASSFDTPGHSGGKAAPDLAKELTIDEAEGLVKFMTVAFAAWGREIENHRLWSALNVTICMWMWRRLVIDTDRGGSRRYLTLTSDQFKKCLYAVSADAEYKDWLPGRQMSERDRAPCYKRLRIIFTRRVADDGITDPRQLRMPQPPWSKG